MTKPWGGAGAWAADSELAESQPNEQSAINSISAFPSLGESLSSKPKKKKQSQTFSISELTVGKYVGPGGKSRAVAEPKGLTTDEMMMLPTGPRDRSEEEQQYGGLGGGFKDYGGHRGGRDSGGDRDRDGGFSGRSDREGSRGGFGSDRDRDEPSRADDNADWGASKKFVPSSGGPQRYEEDRRRVGRSSDRDLPSKADEDDNWGSSKKFVAAPNGNDRRGATRYEDPRGGFHDSQVNSRADEVDNWGASKKFTPSVGFESSYRERDFGASRERDFGASRERDFGADADKWSRKDVPRASERPRLVLQPRTRPLDLSPPPPVSREEIENAPPTVEDSLKPKVNPFGDARPREQVLGGKDETVGLKVVTEGPVDVAPKPRKVNPFGEAKPREVTLEKKGMDWKKFDADLERKSADRAETEDEKKLKEEIKALQELIKSGGSVLEETAGEVPDVSEDTQIETDVREQLAQKESDLEQLTRALNDKVRFSRAGVERPVSRSGIRDSERASDMWTKSNGNGQPQPERRGSRW